MFSPHNSVLQIIGAHVHIAEEGRMTYCSSCVLIPLIEALSMSFFFDFFSCDSSIDSVRGVWLLSFCVADGHLPYMAFVHTLVSFEGSAIAISAVFELEA